MKWLLAILLTILAVVAGWAPSGVQAASLRVPAMLYPGGAHISYQSVLSNEQMDCMWGFFCEGNVPLFHFATQDQLHRVDGWGQFAGLRRHGRMVIGFELFVSRYAPASDAEGVSWSARAFADLRAAIYAHGYITLRHLPRLVPAADSGGYLAELEPSSDYDLVVMGCWTGSLEVEGIVMYDHHSPWAQHTALTDLTLQVKAAMDGSLDLHRGASHPEATVESR